MDLIGVFSPMANLRLLSGSFFKDTHNKTERKDSAPLIF